MSEGRSINIIRHFGMNHHPSVERKLIQMHTTINKHLLKLSLSLLFVLILWFSILMPIGRAGTQHQTIPTAPPTTAIVPTTANTRTPTNPTITVVFPTNSFTKTPTIPSQSTLVSTSQTTMPTATPIIGTGIFTLTATEQGANGTIPNLPGTLTPVDGSQASPTSSSVQTTDETKSTQVFLGILYCFLGVGIILLFIIGYRRYIKSKRK